MSHHPIFSLHRGSRIPLLITSEHGSPYIPKQYKNLGLTSKQIKTCKDWYEPGVPELGFRLAKKLGASFLVSGVSRLVVDVNRKFKAASKLANAYHAPAIKPKLIVAKNPREDELIDISGNMHLTAKEQKARYEKYALPFLETGKKEVLRLKSQFGRCLIFSMHSFYPTYLGDIRKTDLDVMYQHSVSLGARYFSLLKKTLGKDFMVKKNNPWSLDAVDGGIFGDLQKVPGVDLLAIDIKNSHLSFPGRVRKVENALLSILSSLISG